MYFQFFFALDRVKALAPQHPEWKTKEDRRQHEGRLENHFSAGDSVIDAWD
jgi:hypothetical protein